VLDVDASIVVPLGEGVCCRHLEAHVRIPPDLLLPRVAARASPKPCTSPVAPVTSVNNRAPACPTTPHPSAVAVIFGREPVAFTWKVPSVTNEEGPQQAPSFQIRRHFPVPRSPHPPPLMKGQG
jgi:hypothetical protein